MTPTDPFDYLVLALWTLAGIALAFLLRRRRRTEGDIERRVQQSIARLRKPDLRLARPFPAQRATANNISPVEKTTDHSITKLHALGAAMRRAS